MADRFWWAVWQMCGRIDDEATGRLCYWVYYKGLRPPLYTALWRDIEVNDEIFA